MRISNKTVLQEIITSYFNVEFDRLDLLVKWINQSNPGSATAKIQEFKTQLREALDKPGIVTPKTYEQCTDDEELDTQEKVQQRLQETWDACFG